MIRHELVMDGKNNPGAVPAPPGSRREGQHSAPGAGFLITGLIILGLVPILANTLRRIAISLGSVDGSADIGNHAVPLPVIIHVITATAFVIVGAFQLSPRLRLRKPSWHRTSGRLLVVVGMLVALSGLWLNQFDSFPAGSGRLLYAFRLLAGLGMVTSVIIGFAAVRRHDFRRHRQWMIRAYAIGVGAGTQVFTLGFGETIFGKSELSVALLNGAGWAINLAVAEWAIRRRRPWNQTNQHATKVPVP